MIILILLLGGNGLIWTSDLTVVGKFLLTVVSVLISYNAILNLLIKKDLEDLAEGKVWTPFGKRDLPPETKEKIESLQISDILKTKKK